MMGKVLVNATDITHEQPLSKIYMLQLMYQPHITANIC